jgi:hypothetical protein
MVSLAPLGGPVNATEGNLWFPSVTSLPLARSVASDLKPTPTLALPLMGRQRF